MLYAAGEEGRPALPRAARFEASELAPIVEKLVATREPAKPVYGTA